MSFVEAYFTFNIELTHTDRSKYEKFRAKIPKHPNQNLTNILANILVYTDNYDPSLKISAGLFNPEEPSMYILNEINQIKTWIDVGLIDAKRLKSALRLTSLKRLAVYFYENSQIDKFCKELRGSTENWIESIDFYYFSEDSILSLSEHLNLKNDWQIVIADNHFYISSSEQDFEIKLSKLNIWEYYQETIGNVTTN
jgi:uncharacterized protein YaeQ